MKSAKSYHIMQFTLEELCLGGQTKNGKLCLRAETLKTLLFPKVRFTERCKLSHDTEAIVYAKKAAITIPYNAALRQIYLLREEAKNERTPEEILQEAYTGPADSNYFLQDILYVDLNTQNSRGCINQLLHGLVIGFEQGQEIEYVVFERSASQQRQNMLVMIRKDQFVQNAPEDADTLENRIRCGIPANHNCIISKYSAYRALMLTSGICVDAGEYLNQDSVLVVSDYQISHWRDLCKKYDLRLDEPVTRHCATVKHDKGEKDAYIRDIGYISREEEVKDDKLFDGEGLISPAFGAHLSEAVLERGSASSFQIRMPFVKGVVHTVDFHRIFQKIFPDKTLEGIRIRDAFGTVRSISKIHLILTVSMFKMYHTYNKRARARKAEAEKNGVNDPVLQRDGFADYWDAFVRGEHRLFVSGCDEVFRSAPEFTISNYQFLSTLAENDRHSALVSPSVNAMWTTTQSSDSQAVSYVLRSRIPADLLDSGGNEETQSVPDRIEEKRMQEQVSDAELLHRCPQLMQTSVFRDKLKQDRFAADLSIGHLIQPGTMRYLSGDLLQLCCLLADDVLQCEDNYSEYPALIPWMLEAADGVVPVHMENDGLDLLFSPDADGGFSRLMAFLRAVIANENTWEQADASEAERAFFRRMQLAFLSRKTEYVLDPQQLLSSEEFRRKTTQRERRKLLNQWFLKADIYGAAYYAPAAPERRAVIDRNPHLARNEHVVLDPLAAGKLRREYFSHLCGIVMLRVGRDRNVQRLGGADFDGDIVRLFYDPAYIAAAEESCALLPLVIPSVAAKDELYNTEARCELVRRSSGSRVGSFSNLAFRTSLLAYCHRTGKCPNEDEGAKAAAMNEENTAEEAEHDLIKLSCLVGMEIDAVKTNKKPYYVPKEMYIHQRYPGMADAADPVHLNYFLSFKDRVKKRGKSGKLDFAAMDKEIGQYSLVEHLPYVFNPQQIDENEAIPEKRSAVQQKSLWAKQCHQLLWEPAEGKKKFRHRTDPLTAYQPGQKYLYQIVGSADEAPLAPELHAAFCAASAIELLSKRNYVETSKSAKIHTIRRLLAVYLGMNAGSKLVGETEKLVEHFQDEQQVLKMIFRLLPWGGYPNAELRRTHFNMLCRKRGLDFHTDQQDDFDALCCNLDHYVTDHDQLLRILLEYSETEILGEAEPAKGRKKVRRPVPDTEPEIVGSLPDTFGQADLTELRNALWECNTMSALQQTADAIRTGKCALSFAEIACAYGLRMPDGEYALLNAFIRKWDKTAQQNLCSALTTFPSARKQVEKIFYEMIRKNRRTEDRAAMSEEADLRLLGCKDAAEEGKFVRLWKMTEQVCEALHSAKVTKGNISAEECLRKIAADIYAPKKTDWLREADPKKRELYLKKLFGEETWKLLEKQNPLKNLLCDPACWQLLPAILNYARSVSATNARQENRRKFVAQTKKILNHKAYPQTAACINVPKAGSTDVPDLSAAVQEIVRAYREDAKTQKAHTDQIAVADSVQTIDLLVEWASMPQDSVVMQGTMLEFSKKELYAAQNAEAERQGEEAKHPNGEKSKCRTKKQKDSRTSDKLLIDRLTADLYRLLNGCRIEGLKRKDMVRIMCNAICSMEAAPADTAESAVRTQIFRKLIAAERYAAKEGANHD